jgi:hypothetical protein
MWSVKQSQELYKYTLTNVIQRHHVFVLRYQWNSKDNVYMERQKAI